MTDARSSVSCGYDRRSSGRSRCDGARDTYKRGGGPSNSSRDGSGGVCGIRQATAIKAAVPEVAVAAEAAARH